MTLPPIALSPPDRAEAHEHETCEWCGAAIESEWGCRCAMVDIRIDDLREEETS